MSYSVEVSDLAKSFGDVQAVVNVSFAVESGEIFGLLGPNGAGKTTTIRLILDIFRPDRGKVSILDGQMTEEKKDRIGYMPEERGLYQDSQLESCLVYLGTLKGLSKAEASQRANYYFERLDLTQHKRKKVKELSRGMQQKAQVINTILHEPELIIVDEPFSGLDPVNTRLVKEIIQELRQKGSTIIMSTHMMHQVEELCDRIVLIDDGSNVLYGDLAEIQKSYSGHEVLIRVDGPMPQLIGVKELSSNNGAIHLSLKEEVTPQDILNQLMSHHLLVEHFEIATPSLDEIFIKTVRDKQVSNQG
jgi:ABC-2 type transport system ATP-binding protein